MFSNEVQMFIKEKLHIRTEYDNFNAIQFLDGLSGAAVYCIHVISDYQNMSGSYIVKIIDTQSPWYKTTDNEAKKSTDIFLYAPEFHNRLAKHVCDGIVNNQHVIIYKYANDSIINTVSLLKLKVNEQSNFIRLISYELLVNFNSKKQSVNYDSKLNFFSSLLTYRMDHNGSFECKCKNLLRDVEKPAINIRGIVYPNPYYYITNSNLWESQIKTQFFKGNIHGDLHRKNILAAKESTTSEKLQYTIIDYESYDQNNYIFFDHAYLELSAYLDEFTNKDIESWQDTIIPLIERDIFISCDINDSSVDYIQQSICKGIKEWVIFENLLSLQDDIRVQLLLSRITAGVNYLSKKNIQNHEQLIKILLYICISFKQLFVYLKFDWDNENADVLLKISSTNDDTEELWNACGKFYQHYIKVLLTDDVYTQPQYEKINNIYRIDWSLIIDNGKNNPPNDLYSFLSSKIDEIRKIKYIKSLSKIDYSPNTCAWINAKNLEGNPSAIHWKQEQKPIKAILRDLCDLSPLHPFLFIFDCHNDISFAQRLLHFVIEEDGLIPPQSRFVFIGKSIPKDDIDSLKVEHIFYHYSANLENLSKTIINYFPTEIKIKDPVIMLPALDTLNGSISTKEFNYYETSIELVYSGIESFSEELDYGKSFYKGEEIKWSDLTYDSDIPILLDYKEKLAQLCDYLSESKSRVQLLKLAHGAGSGGTTLSKRLLWDIKELFPSLRLKCYTLDTANIISEIYRKTGKCVFIVLEMGSSIISEDELSRLATAVNAQNCRVLFLRVERINDVINKENDQRSSNNTPFINLDSQLLPKVARKFLNTYNSFTDDPERKKCLENITNLRNSVEWGEQCCPFFYGFYTFQESYAGLNNFLSRTLFDCSIELQAILSDLAVITIYSQNLCISYLEMIKRLHIENTFNKFILHKKLNNAIIKLIIPKENGWRLCHVVIAKKILEHIYKSTNYKDKLYEAILGLIERMHVLYNGDDNNKYVDSFLKELLIDRTYIDDEKTRFSPLINDVLVRSKQEMIFDKLISLYPNNPHYYNHLGRMYSYEKPYKFIEAINLLEKAINIAEEFNESITTHYTTIACIYSKKIIDKLIIQKENKNLKLFVPGVATLIEEIRNECEITNSFFEEARKSNDRNSYGYYPNILMLCNIVNRLVESDKSNRNLKQLLDEDKIFLRWYNENISKAVQLYSEMEKNCDYCIEDKYIKNAQAKINSLKVNIEILRKNLEKTISDGSRQAIYTRRIYATALYAQNNYRWNNLSNRDLSIIAENMRLNLLSDKSSEQNSIDGDFWFESYRRLPSFSATEAIKIIEDFMPDSYRKSYHLYLLEFLRYEKKLISITILNRHIESCRRQTITIHELNTASYVDAYTNDNNSCPITNMKYVKRDNDDMFTGLKIFKGIISSIDGTTRGTIIINELGLEAIFTPSFIDSKKERRIFTSKDETKEVTFGLMFSYSGLRAWNVTLCEETN